MPEGPSVILVKEAAAQFTGKKIIAVSGNSKIDQLILLNKKVIEFKSWGKHFLICFNGFTLRVHFLMFGTYRINERKLNKPIRLNLTFNAGEINFYTCSLVFLDGDLNSHYDFSNDVMSDEWDKRKANVKLKSMTEKLICDALLDQDIFAGVGNIIKNEILYRVRIHPESLVGKIPSTKINDLIDETRIYSFQFLEWKRNYELKKHWLAHTKKECSNCNRLLIKKHTGVNMRRSFYCDHCQILYT